MFEKTKQTVDSYIKAGVPGADILVKKDGKEVFRYFTGWRDTEKTVPMDGTERYNIYSCSKPITCTCMLQLWEQGKFKLSDKVSDYLPEYANLTVKTENGIKKAEKEMTVEHLFTMTSGLNYDLAAPPILRVKEKDPHCPTREAVKAFVESPLLFEPGECWEYGLSHDVLACLVEVISGMRFADYAKKYVFDPLGMKNTTFCLPESELETICPQYDFIDGKLQRISNEIKSFRLGDRYDSGGAGCISTTEDYSLFLEALRTNTILKKETVDMMQTDRLTSETVNETYWEKSFHNRGYGLGVRCQKYDGSDKHTEFGWGGAAGAFLSCDRVKNITIYYSQHVLGGITDNYLVLDSVLEDLGESYVK